MGDAEHHGCRVSGRVGVVEFRVAANLESLARLRTVIGAVGTFEDLDFDAVADLRLAVDEACTRLIHSALPDSDLAVVIEPRDEAVVIEASAVCGTEEVVSPGSFSWHVLSSLTDDVQTFEHECESGGRIYGICLTTKRAGLAT